MFFETVKKFCQTEKHIWFKSKGNITESTLISIIYSEENVRALVKKERKEAETELGTAA